jgi:ornithine decarboxylase
MQASELNEHIHPIGHKDFRMEYARRFKFLICVPSFNEADLEGARLQQILAEVEQEGYTILRARRDDDAELAIRSDAAIGCVRPNGVRRELAGSPPTLSNWSESVGLTYQSLF